LQELFYLAKNLDFEFLVLRMLAATDAVPNAVAVTEAITNAAAVDNAVECEAVRVSEAANLLNICQVCLF
jgi:hypothetical protein